MITCLPQTVASVKDDCGIPLLASHMTLVLTLRWSVLKSFELHLGRVLIRFIVVDWLGTKELAVLLREKKHFWLSRFIIIIFLKSTSNLAENVVFSFYVGFLSGRASLQLLESFNRYS